MSVVVRVYRGLITEVIGTRTSDGRRMSTTEVLCTQLDNVRHELQVENRQLRAEVSGGSDGTQAKQLESEILELQSTI